MYYISPPDPSWTREVQRDYLPGRADLLFTSVHEVWPGHFLQFLHANRSGRSSGASSWATPTPRAGRITREEMMWEMGLVDGDPETHIGQLSNALLRDARFLSAIGLHTAGMSVEESERLFHEEAYPGRRQLAAAGAPRHLRSGLSQLHDGQAHDPQATRRLDREPRRPGGVEGDFTTNSSRTADRMCRCCVRDAGELGRARCSDRHP